MRFSSSLPLLKAKRADDARRLADKLPLRLRRRVQVLFPRYGDVEGQVSGAVDHAHPALA